MLGKLLRAVQAMANPAKNKTANAGRFKYDYADLAQVLGVVKPALFAEGLRLVQRREYREGVPYLVTEVCDEKDTLKLSECRVFDYTDAQATGSGLTYARRQELLLVFGLVAEDDDGSATKQPQLPTTLQEAHAQLVEAERAYCKKHGTTAEIARFHQSILTRPDYRNDIETISAITRELLQDVG